MSDMTLISKQEMENKIRQAQADNQTAYVQDIDPSYNG